MTGTECSICLNGEMTCSGSNGDHTAGHGGKEPKRCTVGKVR